MINRYGPQLVTANLQRTLGSLRQQLNVAERQAITGVKVERPSDAPSRRQEIDRLFGTSEKQTAFKTNAGESKLYMQTADTALGNAANVMKRAREIAVQMANEIHSAEARSTAAVEVREMFQQLVDIANTDVGGRFVFAGQAYDKPAFDGTGVYQGTADVPEAQVGANQYVLMGMDGSSAFTTGVDTFGTLGALATALEANDADGVRLQLNALKTSVTQFSSARAQAGFSLNRADDAEAVAMNLEEVLQKGLADVVGVDPVDAYSRLNELRTSYEGALQVSAKSMGPKLFDFM